MYFAWLMMVLLLLDEGLGTFAGWWLGDLWRGVVMFLVLCFGVT